MSTSEIFSEFIANLAIDNHETISYRYGELTAALNKEFRDTDSKTSNTLQVGSFGRKTGINGISDLDMLYIMPKSKWELYKDSKQLKLLQDIKSAISSRHPKTKVRVDRLVVTIKYSNFFVEVQPVFEQDDNSFLYPDTKNNGSWKTTKPKEEMEAISNLDKEKNMNLKRLCKMARAWKNKHGVEMGGLLIDTLAYNFLDSTDEYDDKSYFYYDLLNRDFFKYLSELPDQSHFKAPGSNQHVKVKKSFKRKAKKAHKLTLKAIEAKDQKNVYEKWKFIFGRPFPSGTQPVRESMAYTNTEEFIEDKYPIDIKYHIKIDCDVKQNGFRENRLSKMLANRIPLLSKKSLEFVVSEINVPKEYKLEWKTLNRGEEAISRNNIRGQIVNDEGYESKKESTNFKGDHIVECYAIKDGIVVAKDRIHVPITTND